MAQQRGALFAPIEYFEQTAELPGTHAADRDLHGAKTPPEIVKPALMAEVR